MEVTSCSAGKDHHNVSWLLSGEEVSTGVDENIVCMSHASSTDQSLKNRVHGGKITEFTDKKTRYLSVSLSCFKLCPKSGLYVKKEVELETDYSSDKNAL